LSIQNDGKIAAVWEENNNQWDIVYAGLDLSTITGGKYTAAFTKGIGSKKNPYEVSTVEQANAVNSVYKNEQVNWSFVEAAEGMEGQEEETEETLEGSTEIPTSEMIMAAGSMEPNNSKEGDPKYAIDGKNDTLWHTKYSGSTRDKHWIQVKLKSDYKVDGLKIVPRQSGINGMITEYEILVSTDKKVWTKVREGSWEQTIDAKEVKFKPTDARYVRLVAKNSLPATGTLFASLAELRLTGVKTGESGPIVPEKDSRELLTLSEDKFYLIYDAFDAQGNPLDGVSTTSKTMYDAGGDAEGNIKVNGSFRYDDNFSSAYLWSMEESEYEGSYYMRTAHSDNALGVLAENAREIEGRNVISDKNANHKGSPMKFVVLGEEGNKKYVAIQSLAYTDETYGDLTEGTYMTADAGGDAVQWTDEVSFANKNGLWVVEEVMGKDEPIPVGVQERELLWRSSPLNYHYRIPAIGTNNAGELISVADYRYYYACDIGYWGGWNGTNWGGFGYGHRIDLVSRLSNDQGVTWGEERNHTKELTTEGTASQRANAYGDPSVVGDRESDKVLVLAVGGGLGFMNDKAGIISMLSTDGGHTFGAPVGVGGSLLLESVPEGVTDAYDLEPGVEWTSMFITSGRITQSRYIKVGEFYRLYVAPLTRIGSNNKNWVFYSDDFGKTWAALPGCAIDGADEAKVEELPNGNVVITSRKGSGRYVNIFTYAEGDATYRTGSWGTQAEFNIGSTRGTNGDLYITYAKNQQGEYGYVAIQTLPTYKNNARKDVRIAYKWLDAGTTTPQQFAEGWSLENTFQLQPTHAAYSAMTWQSDGTFGFLWEENDNSYDIVYKKLTLSEITGGKFTSAFTEGIGSVKSPFKVESIEQAQAVKSIYAKEEMNWRFVGEAKQYMIENHPGEYEEPEFEASLTMDAKSGLRIRAWKKTETITKMEARIIEHTEDKTIGNPYVTMENTEDYFTKYVKVKKGTSQIEVRLIAYTDEGATAIKDLQISGSNISEEAVNDLWVRFLDGYGDENNNYVYTGSDIKPKVQVYEGTTLLTEKKDYTLSYKNNTNVYDGSDIGKTPQVVVTGKGNYKGKEIAVFTIVPKDIGNNDQVTTVQAITIAEISIISKNTVQKPVPVISYGKKKLTNKNDKDFTVTYPDTAAGAYQAPGTYKIKIEGKGNYQGIAEIDLMIGSKLMKNMKVSKISNQTYTGTEIFIEDLKVTDGNTVLTRGQNYELEYVNNKEIGKATIIIKGIDNVYAGSKAVTFNIVGTTISKAEIFSDSLPQSMIYNGKEKRPELKLTWKTDKSAASETLVKGKDYEVSYENNRDAGIATIIIKGKGRFNGTMKKTFKILPFDASADSQKKLSVETGIEIAYAKGGAKPQPQVTFGDVLLKEGVDYTLSYSNNKAVTQSSTAKKPQVKVTFKKNFKGSLSEEFTILPQDISKVTILAQDRVYSTKKDGWKTTITLTDLDGKKLTAGTDYEKAFTYYTDEACTEPAQAETYPAGTTLWVKAEGKNNYAGSSITGSYRITKASVAKATVKVVPQYYTSEAITLDKEDLTVKINGTELKYGVDYIIIEDSYINNTKKGTAKVQIQGMGENYGGVKTVSFSI
ncbi:MAG: discoidin domain-containing protein, partial [Lachnospiraceae bacterium]|nr:discoidin domain-containing protein [Lachnospiraceae bacterium]